MFADNAIKQAPLASELVLGGGQYTTGGGITVAVEGKRINGQPHVCGVWAQSKSQAAATRQLGKTVLGKGQIRSEGKKVLSTLVRFARVQPAESYVGAMASCFPVASARGLSIRIPRHLVSVERGIGAANIFFKPSTNRNPAYSKPR